MIATIETCSTRLLRLPKSTKLGVVSATTSATSRQAAERPRDLPEDGAAHARGLLHAAEALTRSALGQAAASRTVDHAPVAHDADAVGHREQLVVIGRDQDDRLAGGGQLVDEAVDRDPGRDVDALRRLVENEEFGPGEQPAADDDLLLIAAR